MITAGNTKLPSDNIFPKQKTNRWKYRKIKEGIDLEDQSFQQKTVAVEKGGEIVYNRVAAGKEWQSKQGRRATCSCLTK
jgi:hypothetical protein